jgi:hypothetical protein
MSYVPRVDAAVTAGWSDLVDELDRWEEGGGVAGLWWRDDDAVAATPQLERLLGLAEDVPLALAVIPALARPELAAALSDAPCAAILQHGWQHADRATAGKKSEYPEGRAPDAVAAELSAGQARLKALFGTRTVPVLVPPWNRFAGQYLPLLRQCAIAGLSVMASAHAADLPDGVAGLDVHIDLVAWRRDRGFIGAGPALGALVGHLQARRLGVVDSAEPIGILTHHLIVDGATADFLDRLVALTRKHRAAQWRAVPELLQ